MVYGGSPGIYRAPHTLGKKKLPVQFEVPGAADLADLDVDVSSSHKPGSKFPPGNTTVTFTAVDDSGNKAVHELVVAVKQLGVENLVLTRTHDKIRAEWDRFGNHTSYGAFITEAGSKKKIEDATTSRTVYTFSNLEPGTDYEVTIYLSDDRRIKAGSTTSTLDEPFKVFYGFDDKKILPKFRDRHNWPIKIPDSVNIFSDSVGAPAPSMYFNSSNISHISKYEYVDGDVVGIFFDNLPDLSDMKLYLSFDHKTTAPNLFFDVHVTDVPHRTDGIGIISSTTEWRKFTLDVTHAAHTNDSVELKLVLRPYFFYTVGNTLYIDNLYLGTELPFDEYRGGSTGSR